MKMYMHRVRAACLGWGRWVARVCRRALIQRGRASTQNSVCVSCGAPAHLGMHFLSTPPAEGTSCALAQ